MAERNWAGNIRYRASRILYPESVEEVREAVSRARKVKALGTRHSFNDIADSAETLVSLERLPRRVSVDSERRTVTVDAGIRYGDLCRELARQGLALPTLASLPHISVAGACATATHGSGDSHANLAASVSRMELIRGDGSVVTLSRDGDPEAFAGAAVHLGGLGVVTELTLDLVESYEVRQVVYENLPYEVVDAHFDDITGSAYSVSLFTDWRSGHFAQVWVKSRVDPAENGQPASAWFGAMPATRPLHPIASLAAENCTTQMGAAGAWHERLPHFRYEFTPSSGQELQSEYFVNRLQAREAFREISRIGDKIGPLLQVSEIRTIARDNLWMSPCYDRASVSIHFTWVKDWQGVRAVLPDVERALEPFEARPHWAKLFTISPERLRALYPRHSEFITLLESYDPEGKFRNDFLDRQLFGTPEGRDRLGNPGPRAPARDYNSKRKPLR